MDWTLIGYVGFVLTSIAAATWSLAIWLSKQFANLKSVIYETKDAVVSKLEYHERHDDTRFQDIRKDIWEIRLRNARFDKNNNNSKDEQ